MLLVYVVVFGTLTWRQQSNFGTFGFDMGIYDQGIWLLSRFHTPFVTVRGLNYFGHHVNPITVLFVPAYWLGAGPHFLYVVETIAMAAGAIPLWLLTRDRTDPWTALVPAGVFLLYPSLEWINWWHFHPDALIITPLLFAWWLASRKKWKWFAVAIVAALLAKEDASLAVFLMGAVLWIRGERKIGIRTAIAGAGWFLICTRVVIPFANHGGGAFYEEFFPGFGNSLPEIVFNLVRHPSKVYRVAFLSDRMTYYRQLLLPVGLLPIGAPLLLFMAAPQTLINVVSGHVYTHQIRYHYSSVLIAVIFIATVDVFCRFVQRGDGWRVVLVALLSVSAIVSNREFSPSPISRQFHSGVWAQPSPRHAAVNAALRLVKPSDGVTATYYLVPHLTHRVHIYEFPNPFKPANWGVHDTDHPADLNTSNLLVLDTLLLGGDKPIYDALIQAGTFRVVFDRDGIVVARRAERS